MLDDHAIHGIIRAIAMSFVDLDRGFADMREGDVRPDPDMWAAFGLHGYRWPELLKYKRVVILAEAGSGKTEELKAQASRAGDLGFYAAVGNVGKDGLDSALSARSDALAAWRASDGVASFFLDSVDEAKHSHVRLDEALRKLAVGIQGNERRARVYITCRHSDWRKEDLAALQERLRLPESEAPPPTADDLIRRSLWGDKSTKKDDPTDVPLVVQLLELDKGRARQLVQTVLGDQAAFIKEIDRLGQWGFCRRPLDLIRIAEYWRRNRRLGSLFEMMEHAITEGLREWQPDRAQFDSLPESRAREALERVGAAMVFAKSGSVLTPGAANSEAFDAPLDLGAVLPDLSAAEQQRLLARPVFDPETLGRVRLHNDNDRMMRGYLTACWLHRLRSSRLTWPELRALLFDESDGKVRLRPSLQVPAAWLALKSREVEVELIKFSPSTLVTYGDPASLRVEVRRESLVRVATELAADPDADGPMRLGLHRFAQRDMVQTIRDLWVRHSASWNVIELLCELVWLGQLNECRDFTAGVVSDTNASDRARELAGRALLAISTPEELRDYGDFVVRERKAVPLNMLTESVQELFPRYLSVAQLLAILEVVKPSQLPGRWDGKRAAASVDRREQLEELVAGLLRLAGPRVERVSYKTPPRDDAFVPALAVATRKLLTLVGDNEVPPGAVEATLRTWDRDDDSQAAQLASELMRTTARRRIAFWRAVEQRRSVMAEEGTIPSLWALERFGYPWPKHELDDFRWLIEDALTRSAEDRKLAMIASLHLQQCAVVSPSDILDQLRQAADGDAFMLQELDEWIATRARVAEAQKESDRQDSRYQRRDIQWREKQESAERDLILAIQSDPRRIEGLVRPEGDTDRVALWLHLHRLSANLEVDSVAPLVPLTGEVVARALAEGLSAHWRKWRPTDRSDWPQDGRLRNGDYMATTGIAIEAKSSPAWAQRLSQTEAAKVAQLATLLPGGPPQWLKPVAETYPKEARRILIRELEAEIDRNATQFLLNSISQACRRTDDLVTDPVASLVAPWLLAKLNEDYAFSAMALSDALTVARAGLDANGRRDLAAVCFRRFESETSDEAAGLFLACGFGFDPVEAISRLRAKLSRTSEGDARADVLDPFLVNLFSHRSARFPQNAPVGVLVELVELHDATPRSVQRVRPNGVVYTPDALDEAQDARNRLFNVFYTSPGSEVRMALHRWGSDPRHRYCKRMSELAEERAFIDAELEPWSPVQVFEFERNGRVVPNSDRELQGLLLRRIDALEDELLNGEHQQGRTVQRFGKEEDAFRNWLAKELRDDDVYSSTADPIVADAKRPDLRFECKNRSGVVYIEVKIADSWSFSDLETALGEQLQQRYLRSREKRYGILLLLYQGIKQYWRSGTERLSFTKVADRLRRRAEEVRDGGYDAPQPQVATLDMSPIASTKRT